MNENEKEKSINKNLVIVVVLLIVAFFVSIAESEPVMCLLLGISLVSFSIATTKIRFE